MICASTNHSIPTFFAIQIIKGKLVFKCDTPKTQQPSGVLPQHSTTRTRIKQRTRKQELFEIK